MTSMMKNWVQVPRHQRYVTISSDKLWPHSLEQPSFRVHKKIIRVQERTNQQIEIFTYRQRVLWSFRHCLRDAVAKLSKVQKLKATMNTNLAGCYQKWRHFLALILHGPETFHYKTSSRSVRSIANFKPTRPTYLFLSRQIGSPVPLPPNRGVQIASAHKQTLRHFHRSKMKVKIQVIWSRRARKRQQIELPPGELSMCVSRRPKPTWGENLKNGKSKERQNWNKRCGRTESEVWNDQKERNGSRNQRAMTDERTMDRRSENGSTRVIQLEKRKLIKACPPEAREWEGENSEESPSTSAVTLTNTAVKLLVPSLASRRYDGNFPPPFSSVMATSAGCLGGKEWRRILTSGGAGAWVKFKASTPFFHPFNWCLPRRWLKLMWFCFDWRLSTILLVGQTY